MLEIVLLVIFNMSEETPDITVVNDVFKLVEISDIVDINSVLNFDEIIDMSLVISFEILVINVLLLTEISDIVSVKSQETCLIEDIISPDTVSILFLKPDTIHLNLLKLMISCYGKTLYHQPYKRKQYNCHLINQNSQ